MPIKWKPMSTSFTYNILPVFIDLTTLNFGFWVTLAIKRTEEWTGFVSFCNKWYSLEQYSLSNGLYCNSVTYGRCHKLTNKLKLPRNSKSLTIFGTVNLIELVIAAMNALHWIQRQAKSTTAHSCLVWKSWISERTLWL